VGEDALRLEEVAPAAFAARVAAAVEAGGRFGGLDARPDGAGGHRVRALVIAGAAPLLVATAARQGSVPGLRAMLGAADWDQREAHDRCGVRFAGDEPHRPLVAHPADPVAWTTPVSGEDVHQVAVGPIHAGVIESGHFRFHVVGERILHVDVRLFYKHRGLERAAVGCRPDEGLALVRRACAACAVANQVAYAQACEAALGLTPEPALRRQRTLMLELERLYNHLNDIGQACAGIGLAAGAMEFADLKDRMQRVNRAVGGHRFLFGTVAVGAGVAPADRAARAAARAEVLAVRDQALRAWREILFNPGARQRMRGTGRLGADAVARMGLVGPAARASGPAHDARTVSPRLWYPGFSPALAPEATGDVAARIEMRAAEIPPATEIVADLLADDAAPAPARAATAPGGVGVGWVESPRGETTCVVDLRSGRIAGLRLRTGSFANWPGVAAAAVGEILPDFPLINKSFELCYACVDR
jgi:Ni,Fe-hydrogenase III large subunit